MVASFPSIMLHSFCHKVWKLHHPCQLSSNFGGGPREINRGKPDRMSLNYDCLIDHLADRRVKEQTSSVFGQWVSVTHLRPKIGVDLIQVSAPQAILPEL